MPIISDKTPFEHVPYALIFYHIPKCGGTTLRKFLDINFQNNYIKMIRTYQWLDIPEKIASSGDENICIAGHYCWGVEELISNKRIYYITLLRHPFKRLLSAFNYGKMTNINPDRDWNAYVRKNRNHVIEWLGHGSFELAVERLNTHFYFTGILEELEKSISFLSEKFALHQLNLNKLKVSKRPKYESLNEMQELFWEYNQRDLDLYDYAVRLFHEKTAGLSVKKIEYDEKPVVMNELKSDDLSLVEREHGHLVNAIFKKNLRPGTIQAFIRVYQERGDFEKALDLFDRFIPSHRFCFWKANLLAKTNPEKVFPFLIQICTIYKAIPSNRCDSSLNVFRKQLIDHMLFHMKMHTNFLGRLSAHFFKNILFPVFRFTTRGFQPYFKHCTRSFGRIQKVL